MKKTLQRIFGSGDFLHRFGKIAIFSLLLVQAFISPARSMTCSTTARPCSTCTPPSIRPSRSCRSLSSLQFAAALHLRHAAPVLIPAHQVFPVRLRGHDHGLVHQFMASTTSCRAKSSASSNRHGCLLQGRYERLCRRCPVQWFSQPAYLPLPPSWPCTGSRSIKRSASSWASGTALIVASTLFRQAALHCRHALSAWRLAFTFAWLYNKLIVKKPATA